MRKKLSVLIALCLAAASLTLAACSGSGTPNPAALKAALHAEDIQWDTATIHAKVGQPLEITITNDGALDHNFSADDFGVSRNVLIGTSQVVTFIPTTSGEFQFYCNVAGHQEAGMVGTISVSP